MAMTVTAAESGTTFNGVLLRVKVLTGTSLSQAGAATASFQGTGAQQASITTTVTGSQVYGALKNSGSTATFTANGSTTLFDNVSDASNGEAFGTCRSTSATGTPGAVTIGASAPSVAGQTALVEVLPSGTITEDASSPAQVNTLSGTTITTASFTPPAGSLLVAMVLADANASTVVTVSGGGLTWTEVKKSQSTSPTGYAGVWIAQIAPASSPVQTRPVEPGQTWLRHFKHRAILPPVPLIPPPPPPTVQPFVGDFIPGVAVPGVAIPANPGTPPAQPVITRAARPGGAWLRHFQHRQLPLAPTVVITAPQNYTQTLTASVGFTGSLTARTARLLTAAISFTGTQTRRIAHGITAGLSFTGTLLRSVARLLTAAVSFTGSTTRRTATTITASINFTGAITKRLPNQLFTASISFAGSVSSAAVHHFTQLLTASINFTGTQTRAVSTHLAAAVGFTGSLARQTARLLTAAVSFTGTQTRRVGTNLAAAISFTGSQTRRIAKTLTAAAISFTGSVTSAAVHHFTQTLTASVGFTGSLATAAVHHFTQALSASVGFTATLTKRTGRTLTAVVSYTGGLTRRIGSLQTAAMSFSGSLGRRIATGLRATIGFLGNLTRFSSSNFQPPPPERTLVVLAENRTLAVDAELRRLTIIAEHRTEEG